ISGHGNDLALFGGAQLASGGLFGEGLSLNGQKTSYAQALTSNPELDFNIGTGDFTVQIWANFDAITNGREETLIEKFSGLAGPGWSFTVPGGNRIVVDGGSGVGGMALSSGSLSIPDHVWQEFVLVRSGDTYNIFWNGNLVASQTNSIGIS